MLKASQRNEVNGGKSWGKAACNIMGKIVARKIGSARRAAQDGGSLYGHDGGRKYLNAAERTRALAVMAALPLDKALFAQTLAWTGARVSEVLALTPASFQIEQQLVSFRTLKRRRHSVREVPLPAALIAALDTKYRLVEAQQDSDIANRRLWPWHRVTAWRLVKLVMCRGRISGRAASPRGFRHGFGVGTLQAGAPLNLVQRWLGHANIRTTAIYADASGLEERAFAAGFWRTAPPEVWSSSGPQGELRDLQKRNPGNARRSTGGCT
jgi:integrase/recombinase XerD